MRLGEALSKPSKTKRSVAAATIHEGQILTGPLFSEPMLVETVRSDGPGTWIAGLAASSPNASGESRSPLATSQA